MELSFNKSTVECSDVDVGEVWRTRTARQKESSTNIDDEMLDDVFKAKEECVYGVGLDGLVSPLQLFFPLLNLQAYYT